MKILSNLNLLKNELQNARIQNLATDPANPVVGQIYFNTAAQELRIYVQTGTLPDTFAWDTVGKEYYITAVDEAGQVKVILSDSLGNQDNIVFTGSNAVAVTVQNDVITFDSPHVSITPATGDYLSGITVGTNSHTISEVRTNFSSLTVKPNGGLAITNSAYNTKIAETISLLDIAAGSANIGALAYNGVTKALGKLYGGTTNPDGATRLNYDGHFYATQLFDSGLRVITNAGTYLEKSGSTLNHATTSRVDTNNTVTPSFGQTFTVVDSVSTNNGHVTAINVKTVTIPNQTSLSKVDTPANGVWITGLEVSGHQITVQRSNVTNATITVGELVISTTNANGNLTVGGNAVIHGSLTVNGTVTTVNTETIALADNIIVLNSNETGTPTQNAGIEVERGTAVNYQFIFDETTDDFRIGQVGDLQPVLTRDEIGNLANNDVLTWDATNGRAVGKTFDELALPSKYAATIAVAANNTYTVTHNLNTTDVVVSIKDVATNEIVFADVNTTGANTVQIIVGQISNITQLRVVVIG